MSPSETKCDGALAELRAKLTSEHREMSQDYERRIGEHKDAIDEWETAWWQLNTELEEWRARYEENHGEEREKICTQGWYLHR